MQRNQGFRATALYERLSRDDEQQGESNSISNQKRYLEDYAEKNGFRNIIHFTDDGYTGTNFNRPGFQAMLKEIEEGNIGTVIVKDMSRFGRNYLQVGYYTEILFPQKNVRYIAVNNSVDSEQPVGNDFAPFLNIMNEWYAKDTSNKIKSVFQNRMNEGLRCSGSIPYGFNRIPGDKQTLVVDPVASLIVKRIFTLAVEGKGPTEIARILSGEKVLIPSAYERTYHPEQSNHKVYNDPYKWRAGTVSDILGRKEYMGHTVLQKTKALNFKLKKRERVKPEDMLVFPNTHEAIVDEETWIMAQKFRDPEKRKRAAPYGTYTNAHILCGLLFCADCGHRMVINSHNKSDGGKYFTFRCGNYANLKEDCTAHNISAPIIERIILEAIKRVCRRVLEDEEDFAKKVKAEYESQISSKPKPDRRELEGLKRRFDELDGLIRGLYENYIAGILPERQYISLMKQYNKEQSELDKRINDIESEMKNTSEDPLKVDKFIELIKKYSDSQELTGMMANELIDKVMIHERVKNDTKYEQNIEIYFNFIGNIDLSLTPKEKREKERAERIAEKKKQEAKILRQRQTGQEYRDRKKAERLAENEGHMYPKRTCAWCGEEFWPNTSKGIYCCKECRYESRQNQIKAKRFEEKGDHTFRQKNCVICGKPFWPRNGQQRVCSEECKVIRDHKYSISYYCRKSKTNN